ncbi:MAG TPA: amidohydrolase family protein [Usitatibacter sp.]
MTLFVVDSQVHIWAPSTPERPWPPITKKPHREAPLSREELLREMDAAGVSRAILVSPSWEGLRNDLVLEAAHDLPDRFAVMGRIEYEDPASASLLPNWMAQPGMLGLRAALASPTLTKALVDGDLEWLWEGAEKAQIPVMVYAPHPVLPSIGRVAERHPGLKLVMCHLSVPQQTKDDAAFAGLDQLLALARFPNVAAKSSGISGYSTEPYPHRNLEPYFRRVYDAFGPKRLFWGTDLSRLKCTYRQSLTMFTEEMDWMTEDDKEWFAGRGICEWLDWPR